MRKKLDTVFVSATLRANRTLRNLCEKKKGSTNIIIEVGLLVLGLLILGIFKNNLGTDFKTSLESAFSKITGLFTNMG